jgi:hypothetical protein
MRGRRCAGARDAWDIEGRRTRERVSERIMHGACMQQMGACMQQMGSQLTHGTSHACDACETRQRKKDEAGSG